MAMTKQIKLLMVEFDLTQEELAQLAGFTPSAFSKKLKKDDWSESDLRKIANATGCEYISYFDLKRE